MTSTLTAEPTVTTQRQLALVVTDKHIAEGIRGNEFRCPVALAFGDAGYPGVEVGYGEIFRMRARGGLVPIHVPKEMRLWITRFDYQEEVHPKRFVLNLPADWPEPEFPSLIA